MKTQNTAKDARSISLSPFCSNKSNILYLEFMVRVCSDSSASLMGLVDAFWGIFTESYRRPRSPLRVVVVVVVVASCVGYERAREMILFAAVRLRQESSFDSSNMSILPSMRSISSALVVSVTWRPAVVLAGDRGTRRA